jgi:2-polyprenyl-6-methoxyphenol hydroxylase-like FAD-dependent oxidoreductase
MLVHSWDPQDPTYDPLSLQGDAALQDLKQRASTFGDGFSFILKSIPDGTRMWHNRLSSWSPEQWDNHNGTITLIGDAAHPMTFRKFALRAKFEPIPLMDSPQIVARD